MNSKKYESYELIVTAAWDEVIGHDNFRSLALEVSPFARRRNSGGWSFDPFDDLSIKVQVIDRTGSVALDSLSATKVNITACPSLRYDQNHPNLSPFGLEDDANLRGGIALSLAVDSNNPLSRLFVPHGQQSFRLRNNGIFDFMVGLAVARQDGSGNTVERRVFRSDPEMDVGCTDGSCMLDETPPCVKG